MSLVSGGVWNASSMADPANANAAASTRRRKRVLPLQPRAEAKRLRTQEDHLTTGHSHKTESYKVNLVLKLAKVTSDSYRLQVGNKETGLANNKHPNKTRSANTSVSTTNPKNATPSTSKQAIDNQSVPSTSRTTRSHPDISHTELPAITRHKRNSKNSIDINNKLINIKKATENTSEPSSSSVDSLHSEASTSSTSSKHKFKKFRKSSSSPTSYRAESEDRRNSSDKSSSSHRLEKLRIRYV